MTAHKHLKQLVRLRMKKTGEAYSSARRQIIAQNAELNTDPALRWHFPGNLPGTTALRVLLAHAGVRDPRTGKPFSEAMLFGIAGGVGIGLFSFFYEKEDFASFFLAGRHNWQDDLGYLRQACELFGIRPTVRECSGAKQAEKQLRAALDEGGPCVAWVDSTLLPHRAMPQEWTGGGYHVVTVYRIDDESKSATIGDLADEPIAIPLADLAKARERIKKQKNRLLSVPAAKKATDLKELVRAGLKACHGGFVNPAMKAARRNFQLDVLRVWAERIHGSKDKENWDRVFKPGANAWRALTSIYDCIEHYGTGGGLCRPLFADFLAEAAAALGDKRLGTLGERYRQLGEAWSALADAALPETVPMFRNVKSLLARKAELTLSGGAAATDEVRDIWRQLGELAGQARARFPLSESAYSDLRAALKLRIRSLHESESAALEAVAAASS